MENRIPLLAAIALLATSFLNAQVLTKEDSLAAGLIARNVATVLSGYGEAKVQYDLDYGKGTANLTRNVLFIGHKFNSRIQLFSEMEIEDARIEGGEAGGEISMEQLFLKFGINRDMYLVAGLFIPRIGIINENHLPTTFNGNDRPMVEQLIIPSTWRELGLGIYGQSRRLQGFNYSFAVLNGLNSAEFGFGQGIRGGRFRGQNATATNIALTGAALYYTGAFRLQVSGYVGGSAGLSKIDADSLQLESGPFGTPVFLGEANAQYFDHGFSAKLLASFIAIPNAQAINRAYANNAPASLWGVYAELGYNLLHPFGQREKSLVLFTRYEVLNMNATIPENGIADPYLNRSYLIAGLTWAPVRGVAIKADFKQQVTGKPNPILNAVPVINYRPYLTTQNFINLGIAYSF